MNGAVEVANNNIVTIGGALAFSRRVGKGVVEASGGLLARRMAMDVGRRQMAGSLGRLQGRGARRVASVRGHGRRRGHD